MAPSSLATWCSCWFGHVVLYVCTPYKVSVGYHSLHSPGISACSYMAQLLVIQLSAAVLSRDVSSIFSVLLDP